MLCSLVRNGLLESLKALDFNVGKEFELVIVSIDPRETPEIAEMKRQSSLMEYGRSRSGEGWNFLVGQETSIGALAEAIGFHYVYDPELDQYAHPSGIVILTPEGEIARYFYGIDFPVRDLRLGLVEAADSKIGSPIDQLLLMCYHYDPVSGEYTLLIMNIIRAVGVLTVVTLAGFVYFLFKRESNRRVGPVG
jgi:protein SCO1/2